MVTSIWATVRHESTMSHKSPEPAPDRPPIVVPVPMDSADGDWIEQFQPESELEAFATPPSPAAAAKVDLTPARNEEGRAAPPSAESVNLYRPDQADVALERSHSAAWPLVLGVVVVLGLAGWDFIAGPVYRTAASPTLTGKSSPVASSSAPAPPGPEAPDEHLRVRNQRELLGHNQSCRLRQPPMSRQSFVRPSRIRRRRLSQPQGDCSFARHPPARGCSSTITSTG